MGVVQKIEEIDKIIVLETGSRKRAVARIRLKYPGHGWLYVNGKRPEQYFGGRFDLIKHAFEPLDVTKKRGEVDVVAKVEGGGVAGQAGAIRLAIARALVELDPELREILKDKGMLKRDPREKERMKYGHTKRRKVEQYSKR